jgi:hypothetical protein
MWKKVIQGIVKMGFMVSISHCCPGGICTYVFPQPTLGALLVQEITREESGNNKYDYYSFF